MSRLEAAFAAARGAGRVAVFPYLTAGYPDDAECERLLLAAASAGADGLELGIPFSDPLADGVTLQRASQTALERGATLARTLALVGRLRAQLEIPIVPMSYLNPLLAYGFDRFCADAAAAGVDGLIVPDVPPEEAEAFGASCAAHGLDYVYMVAPTRTDDRIRAIAARASGFVYCVSLRGVTGARASMSGDVADLLARVRRHTRVPLLVGFGVARPEHVAALREAGADAVVVASALVDLVDRTPPDQREESVRRFVGDLVDAARGATPV
jgi:tryptophan synthase alpha chain